MFKSIIRNYKNAGVIASVSLCIQASPTEYNFQNIFTHTGTGLELHNLASRGYRELLRQARKSPFRLRQGEKFEDIAWRVASYSLFESISHLRGSSSDQPTMTAPYLCLLAEYLSRDWLPNEARDIFISRVGEVSINSFAGLNTDTKILGNYNA